MSEYTADIIVNMINGIGRSGRINIIRHNLSQIDLSYETISKRPDYPTKVGLETLPAWISPVTGGIFLGRAYAADAIFNNAKLQKADFTEADLSGTFLVEANLQDGYLREAVLESANFEKANLRNANFWHSNARGTLLARADAQGANFQGCNLENADAAFADLRGADLSETKLQRVEFSETKLQGAFLRGARLDRTQLRWHNVNPVGEEQQGNYEVAKEVYRDLKINFKSLGYYDDARLAYLKERRMERRTLPGWRRTASWLEDFFTEYMENPWRIAFRLFPAIWLVFSLLNWWVQGLGPVEKNISLKGLGTYLIFSADTIVTLAFSDFSPVGWGQVLAPIEGALGIAAFGLLGYAVAKRIARD